MQRDMETRIDYAIGGVILMWELEEIARDEAQARITTLLTEFITNVKNINDTYFKRAIDEASSRGFHL